MIDRFRNDAAIPVVLDADALNMMAFDRSGHAPTSASSAEPRQPDRDESIVEEAANQAEPRPSGSGSSRPPLPDCRGSADEAPALSQPAGRHGGRPLPTTSPGLRTVITPHPGELARMHSLTTREIQADREGIAVRTAIMMTEEAATSPDHRSVVVLKGAGTIVTDGLRIYVNRTGNPGMATGGSGDVLTGILAALIGQGLTRFDAAVLAVYLHGLAGDLGARRLGQMSLIATDIIDALPAAILTLRPATRRRRR
ncbi:MAG: NAD(P)H-hydrate dehydratase [Phycisphaerae bacterium]|nr:NAD(P)H-hydrate dehydratase [Phycisphaerae bacterium]